MLEALREGELDLRLNIETPDEIGRMARAMDSFVDSLRQKVQLAKTSHQVTLLSELSWHLTRIRWALP